MKKSNQIIMVSLCFIIIMLTIMLYATYRNNRGNIQPISNIEKTGESFKVSVDSPFLYTLLSDLTHGSRVEIVLSEDYNKDTDYIYKLYNNKNPGFNDIQSDVILQGENFLHDINLNNYSEGKVIPKDIPGGYNQRQDSLSFDNYFVNPKNGEIILNKINKDINKYSSVIDANYQRIVGELDNIYASTKSLGSDFENPAIFYAGEGYNLGWLNSLNSKIKIISVKDSKTEKTSDLYSYFINVIKEKKIGVILADRDINPEIILLIRKDIPGIRVNYLQTSELNTKISSFYKNNLTTISDSIVNID